MIKKLLRRIHKDEKGITGLETAIILIAFVVVSSVLAYTVLSAGMFASEKSEEALYAGLETTTCSMALKGSVIATDNDTTPDEKVDNVIFMVSLAAGSGQIDLRAPTDGGSGTPSSASTHMTIVSYTDKNQRVEDIVWTKSLVGYGDDDDLLEPNEVMQIIVELTAVDGGSNTLGADTEFTIEVKPPRGSVLTINRMTPHEIDPVNDLH